MLDISNLSEYVWTTSFDPNAIVSQPTSPSSPTPSTPQPKKTPPQPKVGAIVGSVIISGVVLFGIAYFLVKKFKSINELKKAVPTPSAQWTINNNCLIKYIVNDRNVRELFI